MRGLIIGAGLAGLLAAAPLLPAPAHAAGMRSAKDLRRLNIMLMVTSLRCRATRSDFRRDYTRFTVRHRKSLNLAHRQLTTQLAKRHGAAGASRKLDRMSVHIANSYGRGHPWLDCRNLRKVTRNLARLKDRGDLAHAARQMLSRRRPARFAYAGKR